MCWCWNERDGRNGGSRGFLDCRGRWRGRLLSDGFDHSADYRLNVLSRCGGRHYQGCKGRSNNGPARRVWAFGSGAAKPYHPPSSIELEATRWKV